MGLDATKPVFGGLQATKAQAGLISTFVICLLERISKLATSQCSIFLLVSVAEETGLSLALSEGRFCRVEAHLGTKIANLLPNKTSTDKNGNQDTTVF